MTPQQHRRDDGWRGALLRALLFILGGVATWWVGAMEMHRSIDYPALTKQVAVLEQKQADQAAAIEGKLDVIVSLLRARRPEPHREAR